MVGTLDMRHFSPFSLPGLHFSQASSSSEGISDEDIDDDEALKEKGVLAAHFQLNQRPTDESTEDIDRTSYVDEVLLGSRVEAQVRRLAQTTLGPIDAPTGYASLFTKY